jgi:hypothetical protein
MRIWYAVVSKELALCIELNIVKTRVCDSNEQAARA